MGYEVCVYGTVCVDRIRSVAQLPPPGGYVEVLEERWMPGGEALNTAIALATWNVQVALVPNALGEDDLAEHLLQMLRGYPSLDLHFLQRRKDVQTPTCDVYVTPDGHRTMFGMGFAHMSSEAVPEEVLREVKVLTADANPGEASVRACEQAASAGVPVVAMDLHGFERAARVADILLTSYEWVGRSDAIDALQRIAAEYRQRFGCTVILTAGGERSRAGGARTSACGASPSVPCARCGGYDRLWRRVSCGADLRMLCASARSAVGDSVWLRGGGAQRRRDGSMCRSAPCTRDRAIHEDTTNGVKEVMQ